MLFCKGERIPLMKLSVDQPSWPLPMRDTLLGLFWVSPELPRVALSAHPIGAWSQSGHEDLASVHLAELQPRNPPPASASIRQPREPHSETLRSEDTKLLL